MSTPTPIRFDGELAAIDFQRFDLDSYKFFLQVKALPETRVSYAWKTDTYTVTTPARFAARLGVELPESIRRPAALAGHLFDYQRWAVNLALEAKRYALWLNTGLGKTACYLEWARQVVAMTGGRVLILAPLAVIPQTVRMARDFYGDSIAIDQLHTRDELIAWCANGGDHHDIAMCNYEKLIPGQIDAFRLLAGLVCDESSMLKTGGGKIKWNLIHSAKGIEYKLSCTATPAPNDVMEYASQASFLETMRSEGEVFWTFFSRSKSGDWSVKPHARAAFYRFLSSWSLYLHDPAHFGFADILSSLPDPVVHEERLALSDDQRRAMGPILSKYGGDMFGDKLGVVPRAKLAQLARGFLYGEIKGSVERYESHKAYRVAQIVRDELLRGRQVLVWSTFDEEGPIVREWLRSMGVGDEVAELSGKQSEAKRIDLLERFRAGEIRALISKPQLIGYGLNLQFVRAMVFSGFDDSFERSYQAVRRAYRFGQTEPVHVYWPYIPELEGAMFSNVRAKESRFLAEVEAQESAYRSALIENGELEDVA